MLSLAIRKLFIAAFASAVTLCAGQAGDCLRVEMDGPNNKLAQWIYDNSTSNGIGVTMPGQQRTREKPASVHVEELSNGKYVGYVTKMPQYLFVIYVYIAYARVDWQPLPRTPGTTTDKGDITETTREEAGEHETRHVTIRHYVAQKYSAYMESKKDLIITKEYDDPDSAKKAAERLAEEFMTSCFNAAYQHMHIYSSKLDDVEKTYVPERKTTWTVEHVPSAILNIRDQVQQIDISIPVPTDK